MDRAYPKPVPAVKRVRSGEMRQYIQRFQIDNFIILFPFHTPYFERKIPKKKKKKIL